MLPKSDTGQPKSWMDTECNYHDIPRKLTKV